MIALLWFKQIATLIASGFSLQVWSVRNNVERHAEGVIVAAEYLKQADPRVITERNFLVLFGYKKEQEETLKLHKTNTR